MSKIICPKCGAVNDEDAKFCIKCRELLIFEDLAHEKKIAERKETEGQAYCDKCGRTAYYKCDKCGKLFCNDHINRYKGLDYCEDCRKKIKNKEKIKVVSLVALVGIVIIGSSFVFGSIIIHKASLEVLEFDINPDSIDVSGDSLSFNIIIKLKNNGLSALRIEDIEFSDEILNEKKEIVLSRGEEKSISIPSGNISIEDVQNDLQKIEIKDIKSSTNFLLSKNTDVECIFSDKISPLETFKPIVTIEPEDANSTVSKEEPLFTRSIILKNNSIYPVEINIEITYPGNVGIENVNINGKTLEYTRSDNLIKINNELVDVNMESILELECKPIKCGEGTFSIGIIDSYSLVEIPKEEKISQSITSKSKIYFSDESGIEVDEYYWPVDEIYITVEDEDEKDEESVNNVTLTQRGEPLELSRISEEGEFRNAEGIPITEEMVGDILNVKYTDGNDQNDENEDDIKIHNAIDVYGFVIASDKEPISIEEKFEDDFNKKYSYTLDVNSTYELSFLIIKKTDKVIQNVEIVFRSENQEIYFENEDGEFQWRVTYIPPKLEKVEKKFKISDNVRSDNDIICIEIRYGGHTLIEINIKINIREEDKK